MVLGWRVLRAWLPIFGSALALCACGGGTTQPTPLPTVSLSASETTIGPGDSATLTWSSTNAASCSASGAWGGSLPPSGTQSTGAINADATVMDGATLLAQL